MAVEHVTQGILNIGLVAVVAMGILRRQPLTLSMRNISLFRNNIIIILILLVWDGVRLFRYSGPVQGHFTSHDSGELPHIYVCMFLYIAPIQKWTIWLGLHNFFQF